MNAKTASKNPGKTRGRPFVQGNPGGPGRPSGSRNAATLALDAIGEHGGKAILRKVITAAKAGDLRAAEMILSRLWPPRKGRPVNLALPAMQTPADVSAALDTIMQNVGEGALTPEEGATIAAIIETRRKAIELVEIEARIAALEARNAK